MNQTDSGWRKRQIMDMESKGTSMTKDEALKLALKALDIVKIHYTQNRHVNEAITAIKEALAQPEQKEKFCDANCVWTDHHPDCNLAQSEQESVAMADYMALMKKYVALKAAQPEQEPVASNCKHEWADDTKNKPAWRCVKCGENYKREQA